MASRDNLPVDFFGRSFVPDPADASPFPPRQPPPPVAMSLRTRESSSLALKHIFDQINSSAESGQHVDSQLARGASESKRDEDVGRRDGQLKDACRSTESDLEATQQRAGGGQGSSNLFPLKGYAGEEGRGRGSTPWQLDSTTEKDYFHRPRPRPEAPAMAGAAAAAAPASPPLHSLRKKLPDLDLSFRKSPSHDIFSSSTQTAFGSPISTFHGAPDLLSTPSAASWSAHALQPAFLPQAVPRSGTSNSLSRQPTAQLTIFYSGTVNVYDDVPSDKANAIMLLAGNGKSWFSNVMNPPPPERERTPQVTPTTPPAASLPVPAPAIVASTNTSTSTNPRASVPLSPPLTTSRISPTVPATPPSPSVTVEAKSQTITKRPHAGIELPHARKASLARFLEKRKDRVQVKPQVNGADQDKENDDIVSTEKPCSPKKQRSRSPSPTKSNRCSSPPSRAQNPNALTAATTGTLPMNHRLFMD